MNLNDLHRRLLQDVLEIGNALPLVITGGYAVQAHRIVDRFSRDIDMATDSTVAMETIVATVVEGLAERGWRVEVIGVDPHGARMMTTDPDSGEQCELDVHEISSTSTPRPGFGPLLNWRPSADATPGKMSSASKISSFDLKVPTGTTTRHSPSTGSRIRR
jgi:hypothetical protein